MSNLPGILLLVISSFASTSNGDNDLYVYDQRQNGTYNVQFHLKDVQILAILDGSVLSEYGNYDDYSYDYHDPIDPQLPQPSQEPGIQDSTSTSTTTTEPPTTVSINIKSTITTEQAENVTCKDEKENVTEAATPSTTETSSVTTATAATSTTPTPAGLHVRNSLPAGGRKRLRCAQGFVRDQTTGKCRSNGRPLIPLPFGVRLAGRRGGNRNPSQDS